jgi:hypothetical protein
MGYPEPHCWATRVEPTGHSQTPPGLGAVEGSRAPPTSHLPPHMLGGNNSHPTGASGLEMAMGTHDPIPDGYLLHYGMYVG